MRYTGGASMCERHAYKSQNIMYMYLEGVYFLGLHKFEMIKIEMK